MIQFFKSWYREYHENIAELSAQGIYICPATSGMVTYTSCVVVAKPKESNDRQNSISHTD